jgi:glycosyltransferase involved in cell wall biosynthesis
VIAHDQDNKRHGDWIVYNEAWISRRRSKVAPAVSLIVLSYNNEQYLPICLDSIESQEFDDFEVVIGDDGSKDGASQIIERFVRTTSLPVVAVLGGFNKGIARNYNACLALLSGTYVAHIASDDLLATRRLAVQKASLESTNAAMCVSALDVISADGSYLRSKARPSKAEVSLEETIRVGRVRLPSPTMMYHRRLIDQYGLIPEVLANEDEALGMRALVDGGIVSIPDATVSYRVHGNSTANKSRTMRPTVFWNYQGKNIGPRIENIRYCRELLKKREVNGFLISQMNAHLYGMIGAQYLLMNGSGILERGRIWRRRRLIFAGLASVLNLYLFGAVRSMLDIVLWLKSSVVNSIR